MANNKNYLTTVNNNTNNNSQQNNRNANNVQLRTNTSTNPQNEKSESWGEFVNGVCRPNEYEPPPPPRNILLDNYEDLVAAIYSIKVQYFL